MTKFRPMSENASSGIPWGNAWAHVAGFALLLAFTNLQSLLNIQVPSLPATLALPYNPLVVERLLEVATFLAVAMGCRRLTGLAERRALVWCCAAVCAASVVCKGVSAVWNPVAVAVATPAFWCLSDGIAGSVLWMCWIEQYARIDMRHVLPYYLAANVVQAALSLALGMDPALPPVLVLIALLPLASALLLPKAMRAVEDEPFAQGEAIADARPFPAVPVVLMAVFSFSNVFARDVLPSEDRVYATAGVIVCLVMLLAVLGRGNGRFGVWSLYGVAFPLALAGLFGLLLDGAAWGVAASLCTHAGEALFGVFICGALCNITFRYGTNPLLLFGFAKAAESLAGLLGALCAFSSDEWTANGFTLAVGLMALSLAVCYVMLTRAPSGEITWGVVPAPGAGRPSAAVGGGGSAGGDAAGGAVREVAGVFSAHGRRGSAASSVSGSGGAAGPRGVDGPVGMGCSGAMGISGSMGIPGAMGIERLRALCSRASYEFGLTRREEEVLVLLAQDRAAQQIEDELCVSNSTVKSHTHAVYRKMGLHSRAELVEYVENMAAKGV